VLLANITSGITTGGDYSIIWAAKDGGGTPVPASDCTFGTGDPPTNHLYCPSDSAITGIRNFSRNHCFVYQKDAINRIDYYPNYATPFAIVNMVPDQGAVAHQSIVPAHGSHYFFNENYGFVEYRGGAQFPYGRPISEDIEDYVSSIARTYYGHIVGKFLPHKNTIAWAIPYAGNTTPNRILYYHVLDKTWTVDDKVAWWIDAWITDTNLTWTDLLNQGFATSGDIANLNWTDIVSENPSIMMSNTDGKSYSIEGTSDNGSDYTGERTEPILDFGRPYDRDLLLEVWFSFVKHGNFNMYCHHRSGDTVAECEAASWDTLTEISCNDPANSVTRLAVANRFHQIRYGTDSENEDFGVNKIEFRYVPQGRY
jgi:hypothetical protein